MNENATKARTNLDEVLTESIVRIVYSLFSN